MGRPVYLLTRDLLFRSKLDGVVAAVGGEVTRDPSSCELAVIEIAAEGWEERLGALRDRGVPVLAFGSHVRADWLRQARALGADAVPNSQVERRLTELLGA